MITKEVTVMTLIIVFDNQTREGGLGVAEGSNGVPSCYIEPHHQEKVIHSMSGTLTYPLGTAENRDITFGGQYNWTGV